MAARILVVDHIVPTPDQDSGSASAFSYLQILSRAGFEMTFVPFNLVDGGKYADAVRALGITVLGKTAYSTIDEAVSKLAPPADLVILYRAPTAHPLLALVRSVAPNAKILFHAVDLHHLRTKREAELTGSTALELAAKELRDIELELVSRADATIVVSAFERDLLSKLEPHANVHFIPILREAPPHPKLGWMARLVAVAGFARPVPRRRRDIVFVGGFLHQPNGDGIRWFISEVWPKVLKAGTRNRLVVAGSNLPPDIAVLACDTIEMRGYVENLPSLFSGARLSIAPLRFGAGIKGKVVSSLSFGVPVVATRVAAEGTGLVHGEHLLIGDTPEEMARLIISLCQDDPLWWRLSDAGYAAFIQNFSHAAGAAKILGLVGSLLDRHSRVADEPEAASEEERPPVA